MDMPTTSPLGQTLILHVSLSAHFTGLNSRFPYNIEHYLVLKTDLEWLILKLRLVCMFLVNPVSG